MFSLAYGSQNCCPWWLDILLCPGLVRSIMLGAHSGEVLVTTVARKQQRDRK